MAISPFEIAKIRITRAPKLHERREVKPFPSAKDEADRLARERARNRDNWAQRAFGRWVGLALAEHLEHMEAIIKRRQANALRLLKARR